MIWIALGLSVLGTVVIIAVPRAQRMRRARHIAHLRSEYDKALLSGDKQKAIEAARAYYRYKQRGAIYLEDEMTIWEQTRQMK